MKLKTFVFETSNSIKVKIKRYLLRHYPSLLKIYRKIYRKYQRRVFAWHLRQDRSRYPKIVRLKVGSIECKIITANRFEQQVATNFFTEEPLFEIFIRDIRRNDVVFDIGAGPGEYSACSSKIAKITYAFECFPERGKKVIDQFVANNTTHKGVLMPVALLDKDEVTEIQYDNLDIYSPSLCSQSLMLKQKMTIESAKIDTLIASGIIKNPDMIKIDVEGAEFLVLKGAEMLFHNSPPREVLIEIHPNLLSNFGCSMEQILRFFQNHNYVMKNKIKRKNELMVIYILRNNEQKH